MTIFRDTRAFDSFIQTGVLLLTAESETEDFSGYGYKSIMGPLA